jgi:P27 family predicted phage terminase small subunit
MAAPGRKPKPTIEKELAGNPGKRAINHAEPKPKAALPRRPEFLTGPARTEWYRISRELYLLGLLAKIDSTILAAYCSMYGTYVQAEKQLKRKSVHLVVITDKGNLYQHPLVGIRNQAIAQMVRIAVEFGMTPSARSRVHAEPLKKEKSLAEQLFDGIPTAPGRKKREKKS